MRFIIYIVIIYIVNLFLKSIGQKKVIEEEKERRQEKVSPRQYNEYKDEMSLPKKETKRDIYKDNLECGQYEEYKYEKKAQKKETGKSEPKEKIEVFNYEEDSKENFRKELLKGIIYSEILSEPKSIKNIRKGM